MPKVNYVQCTGTQYIDTGITPSNTTKIEIEARVNESVTASEAMFGARTAAKSNTFTLYGISGRTLRFDHGTTQNAVAAYTPKDRHIYVMDSERCSVDGNEIVSITNETFEAPCTLLLSAVNTNGAIEYGNYFIYYCKIYENDILVRDYIPWISDEGVYCLKDLLSNTLTYSATSTPLEGGVPILNTVYDITKESIGQLKTGDIINCPYSGKVQSIILPKGTYLLEVWGAQGGGYNTAYGGAGGYSSGLLNLLTNTTLYLYAGGKPPTNNAPSAGVVSNGGFNGGGTSKTYYYSSVYSYGQGGGGASDIRIGIDSLYSRVIVAGGGSGSSSSNRLNTNYGGGAQSGAGDATHVATQTTAGKNGSFGQGANSATPSTCSYGPGGGGGGWYGGGSHTTGSNGTSAYRNYAGGGSGYIYTPFSKSYYPSGCLLNSSYYLLGASTSSGNGSFFAPDGTIETGHTGNGYCRISVIDRSSASIYVKVNDNWKKMVTMQTRMNNAWSTI